MRVLNTYLGDMFLANKQNKTKENEMINENKNIKIQYYIQYIHILAELTQQSQAVSIKVRVSVRCIDTRTAD